MNSTQEEGPGGVLAERIGLMEFHFLLSAANGGIRYQQKRAALRFGPIRAPLPAFLAPRVDASEVPAEGVNCASVFVSVTLPWVGLLLTYDGTIGLIEDAS